MFCDACGSMLQSGQSYCNRCGKAIVGPVTAGMGRVARHVRLLGILWIAYAALYVIGACVLLILVTVVLPQVGQSASGPPPPVFVRPLLLVVGVYLLIKAAAGAFAGVGLMQRDPWARTLALIVAFISLLAVPVGTALGVYTLWVLLSPNADEEYREMVRSAAA